MNNILNSNELETVAKIIKDKIFVPRNKKKVTVFLCGADIKNNLTARSKMAEIFAGYPRYELLYPEDLFDDLLAGQGQHSLLKLENILADSVDSIVLFPESPGSFAELGAFSNNEKLAPKMVVVSNKKYQANKSFINYGPYRLIKSSRSGKVIHLNYENLSDKIEGQKIYRKINDYITKIKKEHPVEKNVANILEAENFILPCIYLIDNINNAMLTELIGFATNQDKKLCDIATTSSLSRLAFNRYISKTTAGFEMTSVGSDYVRETFNRVYLDKVRIELLNSGNRRNARVQYDRVIKGGHP
jgi:hypothetical protein